MAWFTVFIIIGGYLLELFLDWIKTIFILPFENINMLWLLVPVWLAWLFTEFFQEKIGTSMGNAISNAVVVLWGSIDCSRQTVNRMISQMAAGTVSTLDTILRFSLVGLIFVYGLFIVILGWKGNKAIRYIGRIRNVTYVFVMFVPIFYGEPLSWNHVIAAILFFPIFYFAIEAIDQLIPDPKAIIEDMNDTNLSKPSASGPADYNSRPSNQYQASRQMISNQNSGGAYQRQQNFNQPQPNQYPYRPRN